jgi:hypothetical protein
MAIDLLAERGVPLDRQRWSWKELVRPVLGKLDSDAFTRVRVLLMSALEAEAVRFTHAAARLYRGLRTDAVELRRVEQHQETLVAWLLPADLGPLELSVQIEQLAVELGAALTLAEPDGRLAEIYGHVVVEDLDHLYRFAALMDRLEGKDASVLLGGHTEIVPGRPTTRAHRHPLDDLERPYRREEATLATRLHALVATAIAARVRDVHLHAGPGFADPLARQLYAEIASVKAQHVVSLESLSDPDESMLERWLLHEASEAFGYWSCMLAESDTRVRGLWTQLFEQELAHVQHVAALYERHERRDPREVLDQKLRAPLRFEGHVEMLRALVRQDRGRDGGERERTLVYRRDVNAQGTPSEAVAAGWTWKPGTELAANGIRHTRTRKGRASS